MKKIGIIGPNTKMCSKELYEFGEQLGLQLASKDRTMVCGGLGGFMEAVCKGIKQSQNTFDGQTIGILPQDNDNNANSFIDLAIPTGTVIAAPIVLPATIVTVAGYLAVAGGVISAVSQITVEDKAKKEIENLNKARDGN